LSELSSQDQTSVEPAFFLSYVRTQPVTGDEQRDPDAGVMSLFYDLSALLNQLLDRDAAAPPGAIDRQIVGGKRWSPELAEKVGTCRVFVALASPRYFRSEWCGREWGAFEARQHTADGEPLPRDSCMIVVRWIPPAPGQKPPKAMDAVQEFAPLEGREYTLYREHGLWGLLAGGNEDTYRFITYRLARRIAEIYHTVRVPPLVFRDAAALPNVFREAE
jgi:TIR domain